MVHDGGLTKQFCDRAIYHAYVHVPTLGLRHKDTYTTKINAAILCTCTCTNTCTHRGCLPCVGAPEGEEEKETEGDGRREDTTATVETAELDPGFPTPTVWEEEEEEVVTVAAEVEATVLSGAVAAGDRVVLTATTAREEDARDSLVGRGNSLVTVMPGEVNGDGDC